MIFQFDPDTISFTVRRSLEFEDDTKPQLYILQDDDSFPKEDKLVALLKHGMYVLFGKPTEPEDMVAPYKKEYKYHPEHFQETDAFVVKLVPQSNRKVIPQLPIHCEQKHQAMNNQIYITCPQNSTELIDRIADLDDVFYIHPIHTYKTGSLGGRAEFFGVNRRDIYEKRPAYDGKGTTVIVVDDSLDESHCAFMDLEHPVVQYNGLNMTRHDKIMGILNSQAYRQSRRAEADHGTFVSSVAVGKECWPESGVAPGAKLIFISAEDAGGRGRMRLPVDLMSKIHKGYLMGAGTVSMSWTLADSRYQGQYNEISHHFDILGYDLPDLAFSVAAGNDGPTGLVSSPGTAKTAFTVGPSFADEGSLITLPDGTHLDRFSVASFTSIGALRDAPIILASGVRVRGARSIARPFPAHRDYFSQDGTSHSTAQITGQFCLIEQKYNGLTKNRPRVSRMFKWVHQLVFAQKPTRVVAFEPPKIQIVSDTTGIIKQTTGSVSIPNFDTVKIFAKDYQWYGGTDLLNHQTCFQLSQRSTIRIAIAWNDPPPINGKMFYNLDLIAISDEEIRYGHDARSIYEYVDITGSWFRVLVISPNPKRFGDKPYFALAANISAVEIPCPGSCFPGNTTECGLGRTQACLYDGRVTDCLPSQCVEPECLNPQRQECKIQNGKGYLDEQKVCQVNECDIGFFLSSSGGCECIHQTTKWCVGSSEFGYCSSGSFSDCVPRDLSLSFLEVGNLGSCAQSNLPETQFHFFAFLLVFIIFLF